MKMRITGAKELRAKLRSIERNLKKHTREGRSVGLHTSAEEYPDDGGHPGTVAFIHEYADTPAKGFFSKAVEKAAPQILDVLADHLLPDGRGAAEGMEQAGDLLKKRIQEGIVDAGLLRTGHLKGQVTSTPIRRED